jgi:glutaredoxin
MRLVLLVSKWCPSCPAAEKVWSEAAARAGLALEVLDVANQDDRRLVVDLGIRTIPATVINGKLRALGTCTLGEASVLIRQEREPQ